MPARGALRRHERPKRKPLRENRLPVAKGVPRMNERGLSRPAEPFA
jgi:hypothetical protein